MPIKNINKNIREFIKRISFRDQLLKAQKLFHFNKVITDILEINDNNKCLFLAPHPDDETFGGAGVLLTYPQNFHVVCVTDGRHCDLEGSHEEKIAVRKQEFINAMKIIKPKSYEFLDIEDRKLIYNYDKFSQLDISNYDYIFLPNFFDQHKDHKALSFVLQKLMKEKIYKKSLQIVFYEIWAPLPMVNRVINIDHILEQKKELIRIYGSQNRYNHFLEAIMGLNRYRGMLASTFHYAEGFCLIDPKTFLKL